MNFLSCLPLMYLNAQVSLFHVFMSRFKKKRSNLKIYNCTHIPRIRGRLEMLNYNSFGEHSSYQIFYHLMLAVNSIFSTRGFFQDVIYAYLRRICVNVHNINAHTQIHDFMNSLLHKLITAEKHIYSSSCILKIKMMNRRSYDGARLRRDGRRCF